MKWTNDKLELVKEYIKQGITYRKIAKNLNLTYDQIGHAVTRYHLKDEIEINTIFKKERGKLRKADVDQLAGMIGERLYENYKEVNLPVPKTIKTKGKIEEMSVLDLGDIHIGMKNEVFDSEKGRKIVTYNMEIFEKEMRVLQDSISKIHSILSNSYSLKDLTVFLLGDIITNDRIFPEQTFEIEKVAGLQIWDAVNYLVKFFNNLLAIYEKITIVGVVGNHGRSNPTHYNEPVENNFEYWVYKMIQKQFENNPRVTVIVPSTRRYIHKIYGWRHLIEHGDQMKGSSDMAIEKQIKELSLNVSGFDVFHMGHYHKLKEREIADKVIVKQNGSWILKDNYAFKKFKTYSVPKQCFFGCSKKRSETWSYKIDLRG